MNCKAVSQCFPCHVPCSEENSKQLCKARSVGIPMLHSRGSTYHRINGHTAQKVHVEVSRHDFPTALAKDVGAFRTVWTYIACHILHDTESLDASLPAEVDLLLNVGYTDCLWCCDNYGASELLWCSLLEQRFDQGDVLV